MNKYLSIVIVFVAFFPLPLWGTGWITVRSSVLGAEVTIDEMIGVKMHVQEMSFAVEEGLHLVMVSKEGYRPQVDTITIHAGENQLLAMWLVPMTKKTVRQTTSFKQVSWNYQLENGIYNLRWAGIGGGLGTGLNLHLSLFDMRFGLFTLEPCLWGVNMPFYSGVSHVYPKWLIHPRDRRSPDSYYEVAIPSADIQFYYSPMIGVQLPIVDRVAFTMSAGPQISWTHVNWSHQFRELPVTYAYEFTEKEFPTTGYQFDSPWFSAQMGILFAGIRSDLFTYFKYQDGYFIGLEYRF